MNIQFKFNFLVKFGQSKNNDENDNGNEKVERVCLKMLI